MDSKTLKTILIIAAIAVASYLLYRYCNPIIPHFPPLPPNPPTFEEYEEEYFNLGDVKRGVMKTGKKIGKTVDRCGADPLCYIERIKKSIKPRAIQHPYEFQNRPVNNNRRATIPIISKPLNDRYVITRSDKNEIEARMANFFGPGNPRPATLYGPPPEAESFEYYEEGDKTPSCPCQKKCAEKGQECLDYAGTGFEAERCSKIAGNCAIHCLK